MKPSELFGGLDDREEAKGGLFSGLPNRKGTLPPKLDKELKEALEQDKDWEQVLHETFVRFAEAVDFGYRSSVYGTMLEGEEADAGKQNYKQFDPTEERWLNTATTMATEGWLDLPFYLTGAGLGLVGSGFNPVAGSGGAVALPQGIRQVLVDRYRNGEVQGVSDFFDRTWRAVAETAKGYATGAVAGKAGSVAQKSLPILPKLTRPMVEVAAFTTTGALLDGRLPDYNDFKHAALSVASMHVALKPMNLKGSKLEHKKLQEQHVKDRLMDLYAKEGVHPNEVLEMVKKDPALAMDLLSTNVKTESLVKAKREYSVSERIVKEEAPVLTEREALNKITTAFIDDLHPMKRWVTDMVGGSKNYRKLAVEDNPTKLARLMRGWQGKASHFYEYGGFDLKTLKTNSKGYRQILKSVDNLDNFRDYITARRVKELEGQGRKSGMDKTNYQEVIDQFDKKYSKAFGELQAFQDSSLRMLVDSGILTEKAYKQIKSMNQDYVPFARVKDEVKNLKGRGALAANNPVYEFQGSMKKIHDPLAQIMYNTMRNLQAVENQMLAKSMVNLSRLFDQKGQFLKKAGKGSKVKNPEKILEMEVEDFLTPEGGQIVHYENGRRVAYKISDPEVSQLINSAGKTSANILIKIMRQPASWLRAGATGINPAFAARNLVRDPLMAFIQTKNNTMPRFGADIIQGLFESVGKTKRYKEWMKSGGANVNMVSMDRIDLRKKVERDLKRTPVINAVKSPLELLRAISEHSEQATRLGEYKLTQKRMKKQGVTGRRAALEAAYESREITLDFARMGAQTKALNQISAFFNATVQGHSKFFRSAVERPGMTALKVGMTVAVPSLLLAWANHGDEEVKNQPDWVRDHFWTTKVNIKGVDHMLRIPKPHEVGIIGSFIERAAEFILDDDPHAFDNMLGQFAQDLVPTLLPTAISPFMENVTNHSFFRDRPLVPAQHEGKLPEYMYTQHTSETAKALSKIISALPLAEKLDVSRSPIAIENWIQQWSGNMGAMALQLVDVVGKNTGNLEDPVKPSMRWSEYPMVSAFFVRNPTMSAEPVSRFYENYNQGVQVSASIAGLKKELKFNEMEQLLDRSNFGALNTTKKAIANITGLIDRIHSIQQIDGLDRDELSNWKREQIDTLVYQAIEIAKVGNQVFDQLQTLKEQ